MTKQVKVAKPVVEHLQQAATSGYPLEVCGVLAADKDHIVCLAVEVPNVTEKNPRTTYKIDPLDLLRVEEELEAMGMESVGSFHSHPDHPAEPSPTDRKSAVSNWIYAITNISKSGAETRFWVLEKGEFMELQVKPV